MHFTCLLSITPLTDIRDDEGQSPLDVALDHCVSVDVPLYLVNHGCGDDKDKANLLCRACEENRLDIVKELVEEHKLDLKGKYYNFVYMRTCCLTKLMMIMVRSQIHCTCMWFPSVWCTCT